MNWHNNLNQYHFSEDFIEYAHIPEGSFDHVAVAKYAVPSHWDIGKVCEIE